MLLCDQTVKTGYLKMSIICSKTLSEKFFIKKKTNIEFVIVISVKG